MCGRGLMEGDLEGSIIQEDLGNLVSGNVMKEENFIKELSVVPNAQG